MEGIFQVRTVYLHMDLHLISKRKMLPAERIRMDSEIVTPTNGTWTPCLQFNRRGNQLQSHNAVLQSSEDLTHDQNIAKASCSGSTLRFSLLLSCQYDSLQD